MSLLENPPNSAEPLRCAQIMGTFGGGGAQRLAINLAGGLSRLGIQSWAVALRQHGSFAGVAERGVHLEALGVRSRDIASHIVALFKLRKLVGREALDVVHVHGASSLPFVILALLGSRRRPKVVFTWHDSESVLEGAWWRTGLVRWALRRCHSVSGSSRSVVRRLEARAGIQGGVVFHGGVPATPDPDPGLRSGACPLIVWLGRIVPSKDPQILVRAAATLRAEGLSFRVRILGQPIPSTRWYMEETQELIRHLGVADIVSTPGFADADQLRQALSSASIAVQTSHTEGLSLALLECMMAGIPLVATAVGDTTSALQDGETGLVVEPRDEPGLTQKLRMLLTDVELRQRLGAAARNRALNEFSIDAMATRAAILYRALLS